MHQLQLADAHPPFELLLAVQCGMDVICFLEVHELIDVVPAREALNVAALMLATRRTRSFVTPMYRRFVLLLRM
jgi:hypothetical protein